MNNALRSSPIGVAYTPEPIIKLPRSWSVQAFTELMTSFRAVYMQSSDRLSFKKKSLGRVISPDIPREPPNPLPGRLEALDRRDASVYWPTLNQFGSVKYVVFGALKASVEGTFVCLSLSRVVTFVSRRQVLILSHIYLLTLSRKSTGAAE